MSDHLEQLLGTPLPDGVAALDEAGRSALAEVIRAARRRQAEDLSASFDATLKYVPFPLRGIVKKVLMG
jgi:hypothetical protein